MAGKIGFVGVGAVGGYYGLMLKKAGKDIHFLLRSNYEEVKKNGFELVHHKSIQKSERIKNLGVP